MYRYRPSHTHESWLMIHSFTTHYGRHHSDVSRHSSIPWFSLHHSSHSHGHTHTTPRRELLTAVYRYRVLRSTVHSVFCCKVHTQQWASDPSPTHWGSQQRTTLSEAQSSQWGNRPINSNFKFLKFKLIMAKTRWFQVVSSGFFKKWADNLIKI